MSFSSKQTKQQVTLLKQYYVQSSSELIRTLLVVQLVATTQDAQQVLRATFIKVFELNSVSKVRIELYLTLETQTYKSRSARRREIKQYYQLFIKLFITLIRTLLRILSRLSQPRRFSEQSQTIYYQITFYVISIIRQQQYLYSIYVYRSKQQQRLKQIL